MRVNTTQAPPEKITSHCDGHIGSVWGSDKDEGQSYWVQQGSGRNMFDM